MKLQLARGEQESGQRLLDEIFAREGQRRGLLSPRRGCNLAQGKMPEAIASLHRGKE